MFTLLLFFIIQKKQISSGALVTHTYNLSYSGSKDKNDQVPKKAQANSSQDFTLKIPNTKKD
jgi:hypothetical protein